MEWGAVGNRDSWDGETSAAAAAGTAGTVRIPVSADPAESACAAALPPHYALPLEEVQERLEDNAGGTGSAAGTRPLEDQDMSGGASYGGGTPTSSNALPVSVPSPIRARSKPESVAATAADNNMTAADNAEADVQSAPKAHPVTPDDVEDDTQAEIVGPAIPRLAAVTGATRIPLSMDTVEGQDAEDQEGSRCAVINNVSAGTASKSNSGGGVESQGSGSPIARDSPTTSVNATSNSKEVFTDHDSMVAATDSVAATTTIAPVAPVPPSVSPSGGSNQAPVASPNVPGEGGSGPDQDATPSLVGESLPTVPTVSEPASESAQNRSAGPVADRAAGERKLSPSPVLAPVYPPTDGPINLQLPLKRSDQLERARARVVADKFDIEAWVFLLQEATGWRIDDARPVYEQLFLVFPTAGRYWKQYVEAEMAANNREVVKTIFSRCLLVCPYLELWRAYLRFVRQATDDTAEIRRTYEFTLDHIGVDVASLVVWSEYISFLKGVKVTTPAEESSRMTSIRRVYQRAVVLPIQGVEAIWKEWEAYESSLNKALAKGLLNEYQPRHQAAKAVLRERRKLYDSVQLTTLAAPPRGTPKEEQQRQAWHSLLTYESSNPQRLEPSALVQRVAFAYDQCLMVFYHHPDVWHDYATFHALDERYEEASVVFKRAITALPTCEVLYYDLADLEEGRGNKQAARAVYEGMLQSNPSPLVYIQWMRFLRRAEGVESARKAFITGRKSPHCSWHFYLASAQMELTQDKDPKVARNILELGLKKYIKEPEYVLHYVEFLVNLNDDTNARVLFERALSAIAMPAARQLWDRYLAYEQERGDLSTIKQVQRRRREAYREADPFLSSDSLAYTARAHKFLDLWPCPPADLYHLARRDPQAGIPLTSSKPASQPIEPVGSTNGFAEQPRAALPHTHPVQQMLGAPQARPQSVTPPLPPYPPPPSVIHGVAQLGVRPVMHILPQQPPLPPLPFAVANFLRRLPPATSMLGVIPDVDIVMNILQQADLSQLQEPSVKGEPTHFSTIPSPNHGKRKAPDTARLQDTEVPTAPRRPVADIFRLRQQQKKQGMGTF